MFIQEYAKNMAKQSKLQLSLLEMEQYNLLLIATAYKSCQLVWETPAPDVIFWISPSVCCIDMQLEDKWYSGIVWRCAQGDHFFGLGDNTIILLFSCDLSYFLLMVFPDG